MTRKILVAIILIALSEIHVFAQTHADATTQKWQGINVNTVLNNNDYPDDNNYQHGYPFLLYNVGTGCFVTQGGDWAMEGRLFYRDFGRTMYLYKNGRINSGLTEAGVSSSKNSFCCRPPEPFGKSWSQYDIVNLTTLMDGARYPKKDDNNKYNQSWKFKRITGESGDTCTYYMYQTGIVGGNSVDYYLGAVWGEYHVPSGKGDGQFVYLDDDRCCWTTASVVDNTNTKKLENGDEIEIQKLYQWRIISVDEFVRVLNGEDAGLNPSISALIADRDFTRNSDDFYDKDPVDGYNQWILSPLRDYTYDTGTKRYTYSWGDYKKGESDQWKNNQQSISGRIVNEPWDSPVKLKAVFDRKISSKEDSQKEGMKNAKNGFLPFEGVGTISTNFEAPKPGWYELECAGFSISSEDHDAYMFARVISNDDVNKLESEFEIPEHEVPHYGTVTLQKLPFGTYQKDSYRECLKVGNELRKNPDNHKQKVWVLVSQNDWDNNNRTIRVGFGKNQATKSTTAVNGGYYDTDWVCVDDLRASYMGLSPVFFYEDEENLKYLSHDEEDRENFSANEYVPATLDGRYGGSACLQRSFTVGEWNTFSFLLPLTGEQVRYAFGDECELLKLHSIGGLSNNDCVIDFQTVNLLTTSRVVEPGKLYLMKTSKVAAKGENPRGKMENYYDLGKLFFSTNAEDADDPNYKYPVISLSQWGNSHSVGSFDGKNDGNGWITYVQTPGFSSFRVTKGIYNGSVAPPNSYAPKGSYGMSKGIMYELSKDTRIKGFRGWITLTHSIFEESNPGTPARISINGIIEGDTPTDIDSQELIPVKAKDITGVYDLSGRRLNIPVNQLPHGMYIVCGKKVLIK